MARYFRKILNLNKPERYDTLRKHPMLVPLYKAGKSVAGDFWMQRLFYKIEGTRTLYQYALEMA